MHGGRRGLAHGAATGDYADVTDQNNGVGCAVRAWRSIVDSRGNTVRVLHADAPEGNYGR